MSKKYLGRIADQILKDRLHLRSFVAAGPHQLATIARFFSPKTLVKRCLHQSFV